MANTGFQTLLLDSPENQGNVNLPVLRAATSNRGGLGEVVRGWNSAGYGEKANALYTAAQEAYAQGDDVSGQYLEKQANELRQLAGAWKPSVDRIEEVRGISGAANFVAGGVGNLRSSVKPMLGGVAGGLAGALVGMPVLGAAAGAGVVGTDVMRDEAVAGLMTDPEARKKLSYDEIGNYGLASGMMQAPLEVLGAATALSPFSSTMKNLLKREIAGATAAKGSQLTASEIINIERNLARKEIAESGLKTYVAKKTGEGAAGEFGTETAQSIIGQGVHNFAADNDKPIDMMEAVNSGILGAVGGGFIGGSTSLPGALGAVTASDGESTWSSRGGEALAAVGKKGASLVDKLYHKVTQPTNTDPAWHVLNQPLDQADPISSANARNAAGLEYAAKVMGNNAVPVEENELAAKYLSAMKTATTDQARDAATAEFRDGIVKMRGYKDDVGSFVEDLNNFKRDTESRGSAQKLQGELPGFAEQTAAIERTLQGPTVSNPQGRANAAQVAQLWLKNNAKITEVFPNLDVNDPQVRNGAQAMFDWVIDGMPNVDKVSHTLYRMWGKEAAEKIQKVQEYALAEGLVQKTPEITQHFEKANAVLKAVATNGQSRRDSLGKMLRPTMQDEVKTSDLKEMDKLLAAHAEGKSVGSPKRMKELLDHYFGQNADDVLARYERDQDETLEYEQVTVEETDDDGESVETKDWSGNIQEEQAGTTYHGHGSNVGFDTIYPRSKDALTNLKHEILGMGSHAYEVGAWTKLKNELKDSPAALRVQEDGLIKKYHGLDAKGLEEAAAAHGHEVNTERESLLKAINKRVKFVAEMQREEKEAVDITEADINLMADYKGPVTEGRLILERMVEDKTHQTMNEDGEIVFGKKPQKFYVSVGNIVKVVRKKMRDTGGLDEKVRQAPVEENAAAETHRLLMTGLSSLMNVPSAQAKAVMAKVEALRKAGEFEAADRLHDQELGVHDEKLREFTTRVGFDLVVEEGDKEVVKTKWFKNHSQLPQELFDKYTGQSAEKMKAGLVKELYSGDKEGSLPLVHSATDKVAALQKFADAMREKDNEKFADFIEMEIAKGIPAVAKLYKELRGAEMPSEKPRKTAAETRVTQRIRGRTSKIEKVDGVDVETDQINVETKVFRDDPTELDEMADNGQEGDVTDPRHFDSSQDRDETGQVIPNRDAFKVPTKKQIAYIKNALDKGVASFVKSVKAMTGNQRDGVRAVLRALVKDKENPLGELKVRAENALKLLRGVDEKPVTKSAEEIADIKYLSSKIRESKEAIESLQTKIDALKVKRVQERLEKAIDGEPNLFGAEARVRELQSAISDHESRIRMFERELAEKVSPDAARVVNTKSIPLSLSSFAKRAIVEHFEGIEVAFQRLQGTLLRATVLQSTLEKLRIGVPKYRFFDAVDHNIPEIKEFLNGIKSHLLSLKLPVEKMQFALYDDGGKSFMGYEATTQTMGISWQAFEKFDLKNPGFVFALFHEVGHFYDMEGVARNIDGNVLWDSTYLRETKWLYDAGGIGKVLDYPFENMVNQTMSLPEAKGEMFAQVYSIYTFDPSFVQQTAPSLYDYFKEITNASTIAEVRKIIRGESQRKQSAGSTQGEISESGKTRSFNGQSAGISETASSERPPDEREGGGEVKNSAQALSSTPITAKQKKEIKDELSKTLGDKIKVIFSKTIQNNWSGAWTPELIRIAVNASDALGTARHESIHQLMRWMRDAKVEGIEELLKNVAMNKTINRQLHRLLQDSPDAIKSLSNPEEAAAYLYQFWKAGLIQLGPKSETLFQKVTQWLRKLTGLVQQEVRDAQHAEEIMQAFSDGKFKDGASAELEAMERALADKRRAYANSFMQKFLNNDLLRKAVFTAGDVLRDTKNPALVELADMLHTPEAAKMGAQQAYFDAVPQQRAHWLNKLNGILKDVDKEDVAIALKHLQSGTKDSQLHDPVIKKLVGDIRQYFDEIYDYASQKGVQRWDEENNGWMPMPKIKKDYFPQVWDVAKLLADPGAFTKKLLEVHKKELDAIAKQANEELKSGKPIKDKGFASRQIKETQEPDRELTAEDIAGAITSRLMNNAAPDITESTSTLGITPQARAVNRRVLNWIDKEAFAEFQSDDIASILTNYTVQMVKRAEYTSRFGNEGEVIQTKLDEAYVHNLTQGDKAKVKQVQDKLDELTNEWAQNPFKSTKEEPTLRQAANAVFSDADQDAALKKMQMPVKAVMAAEGTIGRDIDPKLQQAMGYVVFYQNLRLLTLSLFSSFIDPLGMIVRGGTVQDAFDGFVRGVKEIKHSMKGEYSNDEMAQLAERLGTVDAGSFMDALGQTYSSIYVHGKLRKWNDAIFKWNGMEAWNRAMRIQGTAAAVGFIEKHLTKPGEHSQRYLQEELGLDPKADYMKDGKLDTDNLQVQQAIVRWVNGAILRPNAMQRPIVASDPHYELFYHLKQFTYSFHKVILTRAAVEMKHGNFAPAASLLGMYVPMMIAADVMKELLVPGDDPPWMKMGLGAAVSHGIMRANLMGVPQLGIEAFSRGDPSSLFGPSPEQLVDWALVPLTEDHSFGKEFVRSLPASPLTTRMSTLFNESRSEPSGQR